MNRTITDDKEEMQRAVNNTRSPRSEEKSPLLIDGGKDENYDSSKQRHGKHGLFSYVQCMSSTRLMVLLVLCLQNSMFTVVRRYSLGILREAYSKAST